MASCNEHRLLVIPWLGVVTLMVAPAAFCREQHTIKIRAAASAGQCLEIRFSACEMLMASPTQQLQSHLLYEIW
jgi:hypothetical protein